MIAFGRLLRVSLAPSAVADVVAGLALGSAGLWPKASAAWWMLPASLGIYHGGMALNDWADRAGDARTRPERPVPAGEIPAPLALLVAVALFAGGLLAAAAASPRLLVWMGVVALAAIVYDLAGRGAWRGPLLLAVCRFGNFGGAILAPTWAAGEIDVDPRLLAPAVLYGVYVFAVSRLGRLEDDEDRRPLGTRPGRSLGMAAAALACVPLLALLAPKISPLGALASATVAFGAAFGLARAAIAPSWSRADVGRAMGLALRRLLAFTAACALLVAGQGPAGWVAAGVAALGYPVSYALRRVIPPS